ncbi:uncharacterized protein LOC133838646 isoform X3 [Drosophila sulfurigaster albostrigata]|uniref:uncharacterized protein LOC133838646 isoform X3 n=1 Tax=Drosophila sulfurigaster albostrigata TaxID=89887 RepID=UPI002D21CBB3|nr:uncharacterized protein LOC133838646 isoform X3 [Drosophila sulfurigaster albostrigata]
MDYIFECFYNDTFEHITRNGLQDRQSRRDILDHLSAIIKGCSEGQNVHTEEVASLAVVAAMRYHQLAKDGNGKVCLMGKYHNILYIALRTCWDWGVRDSEVVVQLLVAIYQCEKTFERIFLGALFGPHAPHFIAGWRSDFRDQHENVRAMVYFLKHATREQLMLPVWIPRFEQERQLRFIDVPIESCGCSSPLRIALQANAPELLLILLSCRIRDILREHNQLPNGIDTLRLPKRLQRYIDLTEELEGPELQHQQEQQHHQQQQPQSLEKPMQRLTNAMQRLETISGGGSESESEDESENHVQLLEAVTDAEKAAVAAFVETGNGAITEEAKQAAIAAYMLANETSNDDYNPQEHSNPFELS